ncbi:DUF5335 domain-containing protein [Streptosporangium sp. NBC_01755]|uniref:DUF5335 family protein n=1 Tax=unclassified Streptosporangium TaxID=2632669 RepID=UPI002DDC157D|nr:MULTISPECIES: DUF5335 family protein [unclassified Streptosporangium]WSA25307.1 DUF5335 domain-containing protein [Streptosporangium sp. NBC_01810]WSD03376.1 DUF5335 domain-containing protein [Streptosporangium sp. NBC_01755]
MNQQRPELTREEWHEFFDNMTRNYEGTEVTIEVMSKEFGDLLEAEKLPLAYLEYDAKDDQFSAGVGGRDGRYPVVLRHTVDHPQRILTDTMQQGTMRVFDVFDADGGQTIVTLYLTSVSSA